MTEYIQANPFIDTQSITLASYGTAFAGIILLGFFAQRVSEYVNLPILSLTEYMWHGIVSLAPTWLVRYRLPQGGNGNTSTAYAAKSQSIRSMFRLDKISLAVANPISESNAPKGLGNWDNSCYQNSILQALSSVSSVSSFLSRYDQISGMTTLDTTTQDLADIISRLNNPSTPARYLWTPARLKSMDSWQQQDAQEYYARISDEVEKDFVKILNLKSQAPGFESLCDAEKDRVVVDNRNGRGDLSNPMEGLLAQRIGCTNCGYVEGLSLIPFTSLTLPLLNLFSCDVAECLDNFTALESIEGVECLKCTLLQARQQLLDVGDPGPAIIGSGSIVDEVSELADPLVLSNKLLQTMEDAIADENFTEATVAACKVPKSSHATCTKTRQAVVIRPPKCLTLHFNRSMFDEMTGDLRKNYAATTYPKTLALGRWSIGGSARSGVHDVHEMESWTSDPMQSILLTRHISTSYDQGPLYNLCAVVTHLGRHENGHYVCFRKMPQREEKETQLGATKPSGFGSRNKGLNFAEQPWWRISDDKVLEVTEHDALAQEGAFMLFYERNDDVSSDLSSSLVKTVEDEINSGVGNVVTGECGDTITKSITPEGLGN